MRYCSGALCSRTSMACATALLGASHWTGCFCWPAGPGLAVRILGDVTEGDKLEVLRHVDEIFINTIRDFGLYDDIWQAFAVFLPVK